MVQIQQGRAYVASVVVFETVDGDWKAKIRAWETKQVTETRFAYREQALNWVKSTAVEMFGPLNFHSIRFRKGSTRYEATCSQPEYIYQERLRQAMRRKAS